MLTVVESPARKLWRSTALVAVICMLNRPAIAADIRPVQGPVILVHSGAVDEYLWYASDYVAALVDDRLLGVNGMRALEGSSVLALMDKARSSRAKTLVLTVLYKPPTSSSIYGVPTVSNNGSAWAESVVAGRTPEQVKIKVSGKLPPAK
jgi:hypothetical protein